jgi:acetylornithine deacetylase/succinyl-diaminopimelate desuccinylase-like protein
MTATQRPTPSRAGAVPEGLDTYLEANRDRFVAELLDLIRIPGVAADDTDAVHRTADAVAAKCERAGMTTRVEQTEGNPVVCATAGPEDSPVRLLTYGHYDVFPVAGQTGWDTEPFEPVITGDRIYARGSGDSKGQFLAHLDAYEWWQRENGGLPIHLTMILEGEEEVGSPHLPAFVEAHRDELRADLCVYSDGAMLGGDQPAILFGSRGALCMEFRAHGPSRPLHSGNFGGTVTNPILRLSRLFAEMIAPNGDILVPGVEQGMPEMNAAERTALRGMAFDEDAFRAQTGQRPVPLTFDEPYYERLLYKPSFNVSGIAGGQVDKLKTLVPTDAVAKVDMRLVGTQDPDAVLDAIRRFAHDKGYDDIEVVKLFSQPPSRTPIDHPAADVVERAVEVAFGREVARVPSLSGTTPDWVFTKLLGLPTFMVPFGPVDENHHGPNESMKTSLLLGGIRSVATLIELLSADHERTSA